MTKGSDFMLGRDSKVISEILRIVGGMIEFPDHVEKTLNCGIKLRWD